MISLDFLYKVMIFAYFGFKVTIFLDFLSKVIIFANFTLTMELK